MKTIIPYLLGIVPDSFRNVVFRLVFRRSFFPLYRILHRFSLRGLGINHSESFALSGEKNLISTISEKLSEPLIFDVGAHRGNYSQMLLESFTNVTVYAFEPHPDSYDELTEKFQSERINVFPYALGNESKTSELHDFASKAGTPKASTEPDVFSEIYRSKTETFDIEMTTIDTFLRKNDISTIDLLKIDVEGKEYEVLEGAQETLEAGKIDLIQFEFNSMNLLTGKLLNDFRELLSDYRLFRLFPDGFVDLDEMVITEREVFKYQNILAVHENSEWVDRIK